MLTRAARFAIAQARKRGERRHSKTSEEWEMDLGCSPVVHYDPDATTVVWPDWKRVES